MLWWNRRLRRKAELIVELAARHAVMSFEGIAERYPLVDAMVNDIPSWYRITTIAFVGSAYFVAAKHDSKKAEMLRLELRKQLHKVGGFAAMEKNVATQLKRPYSHERLSAERDFAVRFFDDLCKFVSSGPGATTSSDLASGWWVLWNIKGSDLDDKELEAAFFLGAAITQSWVQQDVVVLTDLTV